MSINGTSVERTLITKHFIVHTSRQNKRTASSAYYLIGDVHKYFKEWQLVQFFLETFNGQQSQRTNFITDTSLIRLLHSLISLSTDIFLSRHLS